MHRPYITNAPQARNFKRIHPTSVKNRHGNRPKPSHFVSKIRRLTLPLDYKRAAGAIFLDYSHKLCQEQHENRL